MQAQLPEWSVVLFDEALRYLGAHGGRGSAKSNSFVRALLIKAATKPLRVLCAREFQKSIRDSSKRLLDDIIAELKLEGFTSTDTEIRHANGSLFIFAGLHANISNIKSMEGLDICWVDEAQNISQTSLDVLIPTMRKPGSQLWFTWNPYLPTDPIDVLLRGDNPPPRSLVVEVNHDSNPFMTRELTEEMEYLRGKDPEMFLHVWEGKYLERSDANVFKKNDWRVGVMDVPADIVPRYGADFGFAVDPSVMLRCWVIPAQRTIYVDREAYMVGLPTESLPDFFRSVDNAERFTSVADSARPETIDYLQKHGFPKMVGCAKGANSVEEGVEFLRSFTIVVAPHCKHVIDELANYKYKTEKLTKKVLPVLEDKNNHCIAEGERVLTERGYVPIEQVTTSDRVMTRGGWRRVLFADVTDVDRDVVRVTTTTGSFVCTPDHEVWTSKGFVRADALRYDDEVIGDTQWASLTTSKLLNGAGRHGAATPAAVNSPTAGTSNEGQPRDLSGYIEQFGPPCTERFHLAAISTTSTRTLATTTPATSCASHPKSTQPSTHGSPKDSSDSLGISTGFALSQNSGTPALRDLSSIGESAAWLTPASFPRPSHANSAALSSSPAPSQTVTVFAPTNASRPTVEQAASTMSTELARAELSSAPTSTATQRLAPGRVLHVQEAGRCARVYDLTVEEHHEFIVEGVLVSNCIDALRYALEADRRTPPVRVAPKVNPIPTQTAWGSRRA